VISIVWREGIEERGRLVLCLARRVIDAWGGDVTRRRPFIRSRLHERFIPCTVCVHCTSTMARLTRTVTKCAWTKERGGTFVCACVRCGVCVGGC